MECTDCEAKIFLSHTQAHIVFYSLSEMRLLKCCEVQSNNVYAGVNLRDRVRQQSILLWCPRQPWLCYLTKKKKQWNTWHMLFFWFWKKISISISIVRHLLCYTFHYSDQTEVPKWLLKIRELYLKKYILKDIIYHIFLHALNLSF